MNKLYIQIACALCISFLPYSARAVESKLKTITGIVTRVVDTQVVITTGTGNTYYIQTASAQLSRRYGSPMTMGDILPGDKLEAKGIIESVNFIPATTIRSLTLYTHNGTVAGKIISTNLAGFSFTLEDRQLIKHTVYMDSKTSIKKNSVAAIFNDIETGMKVTVQGTWERTNANIAAKEIILIQRLIAIEVTGALSMRSPTALTITGNQGALYGVDISKAKLLNKKGTVIPYTSLSLGGKVKIIGKHVSGKQQIIASSVKDYSVE